MRILVVLLLVHGLVPDLAEIGEAAVHWVQTGHAAHTAADRGDLGDQGAEHGCGTTRHRCACCATESAAPADQVAIADVVDPDRTLRASDPAAPVRREPARPFRPPIS